MSEQSKRCEQGHNPEISEAEPWRLLAVPGDGGLDNVVHAFLRQDTVVAEALDFQQTSVYLAADLLQARQVGDIFSHPKVLWSVDGGLSAQSSAFLEILLDIAVLIIDVEGGMHPLLNNTGAKRARGLPGNFTFEDQLHSIRSAQVYVFTDNLLEELPALYRAGEDLGETHLQLPHREAMSIAGLLVLRGKRERQLLHPLVEERLDLR